MVCLSIFQLIHHYELESISPPLAHTRRAHSLISIDGKNILFIFHAHTHARTSWVRCRGTSRRLYLYGQNHFKHTRHTHNGDFIFAKRVSYFMEIEATTYWLLASTCGRAYCDRDFNGKMFEKKMYSSLWCPIHTIVPLIIIFHFKLWTDDDEKYSKCLNRTNLFSEISNVDKKNMEASSSRVKIVSSDLSL